MLFITEKLQEFEFDLGGLCECLGQCIPAFYEMIIMTYLSQNNNICNKKNASNQIFKKGKGILQAQKCLMEKPGPVKGRGEWVVSHM